MHIAQPDVDGLVNEDVGEPKLVVILVLDQHQVFVCPLQHALLHPHAGVLPEKPEHKET